MLAAGEAEEKRLFLLMMAAIAQQISTRCGPEKSEENDYE
jgi:hypothetical protein